MAVQPLKILTFCPVEVKVKHCRGEMTSLQFLGWKSWVCSWGSPDLGDRQQGGHVDTIDATIKSSQFLPTGRWKKKQFKKTIITRNEWISKKNWEKGEDGSLIRRIEPTRQDHVGSHQSTRCSSFAQCCPPGDEIWCYHSSEQGFASKAREKPTDLNYLFYLLRHLLEARVTEEKNRMKIILVEL